MPTMDCPRICARRWRSSYDEVRALERRRQGHRSPTGARRRGDPVAQRLLKIPGIGVITATALLGAVAHIHAFRRGRHFASWLGLTPQRALERVPPPSRSHQQARRRLSALFADARRPRRLAHGPTDAAGEGPGDAVSALGGRRRSPARPQQSGDRRRQQAGAHRLGGVAQRTEFQRRPTHGRGRITRLIHGVLSENILIMA